MRAGISPRYRQRRSEERATKRGEPRRRAEQAPKIGTATSGARRGAPSREGQAPRIAAGVSPKLGPRRCVAGSRAARLARQGPLHIEPALCHTRTRNSARRWIRSKAANRATATFSEMFGELGRSRFPGSMIRSCSACVPAVARDSSKRAATSLLGHVERGFQCLSPGGSGR